MIVPAAAPVIIPECRHTGVAVPRVCGAPRPIGWLPPLTPGLLAKPQPLPLPSFPPLAPPRGARLPMPARRAPESPCVHTWDPHSPHLEPVSYTHLRAHETVLDLVCRLLLEKKKKKKKK